MQIAIHQPNYAPWCGYFTKMLYSDVFVFLDDVQMPGGQSYVYRTKILGREGGQWLSVPTRFSLGMTIRDVTLADARWPRKHLGTLRATYARSPHFYEVFSILAPIYEQPEERLATFNERLICAIAAYLELPCRFEVSSKLNPEGEGDDRLISLARILGAREYLSGKGGQNYQDPSKFAVAGIKLNVRTYTAIPYKQFQEEFVPNLSILDALFYLGKDTLRVLKYLTI